MKKKVEQTVPLEQRICMDLLSAGVHGVDGCFPICVGPKCCRWESCECEIEDAKAHLEDLKRRKGGAPIKAVKPVRENRFDLRDER